MNAPRRFGTAYVWVTWVTGLLSGDKQCAWAAWHRANFRYAKRPDPTFDSAAWISDHNALVHRRSGELQRDGWDVTVEAQNDLKLRGKSATLAGKPDIVAVRGDELLISDAKTGRQRASDFWQVLLYMLVLPRVKPLLAAPERISGEIVYPNVVVPVAPHDLTLERKEQIFTVLRMVGEVDLEPKRTPSVNECRFCDLAECPDRIEAPEPAMAAATEF